MEEWDSVFSSLVAFLRETVVRNVPLLFNSANRVVARGSNGLGLNVPNIVCVNNVDNIVKTFLCRGSLRSGTSTIPFLTILVPLLYYVLKSFLTNLLCYFLAIALHTGRGIANLTLAAFKANFNGFFNNSLVGVANSSIPSITLAAADNFFEAALPNTRDAN